MMRKVRAVLTVTLLCVFGHTLQAEELQAKVEQSAPLSLYTNLAAEVLQSPAAGMRVKKGELVIELENRVARARLVQAQAEQAHQKLRLAEAQNELERTEELYERTLLSDHDLDLARIAHAAAQSSYRRAQTELKAAQRDLELRRITAPFNAQVVERFVAPGETVNGQFKSALLLRLIAIDIRRLSLDVAMPGAQRLEVGDEIDVKVNGRHYRGALATLAPSKGKAGKQLRLEITFSADADGSPEIGETARVILP